MVPGAKWFQRFARKEGIADETLRETIARDRRRAARLTSRHPAEIWIAS